MLLAVDMSPPFYLEAGIRTPNRANTPNEYRRLTNTGICILFC